MNEFNETSLLEEDLPDFEETETTETTEDLPEETEAAPQPEAIESKQSDVLMQYLATLAQTDAQVAEGLKNPKKTQAKMYVYIRSEAQKQAKNGMAMIKDDVVFGWAIHYWTEELPSDNEKKPEPKKPKAKTPKAPKAKTEAKPTTPRIDVKPTEPVTPEVLTSIRDRYKKLRTATEDIPTLF